MVHGLIKVSSEIKSILKSQSSIKQTCPVVVKVAKVWAKAVPSVIERSCETTSKA